jgi:TolB protein
MMKRRTLLLNSGLMIGGLGFACFQGLTSARAQTLEATVDEGVIEPLPIAVAISSNDNANAMGERIAQVVMADLERSGFFAPLNPAAFIDRSIGVDQAPRFENWKILNVSALVAGKARMDESGRLSVDFRLWDVYSEKNLTLKQNDQELLGLTFSATPENWRRIAHKIADAVFERLTGLSGYFDTRIVFVAENGGRGQRVKRLAIMDQDGANPSYLTSGQTKVMTPRFSANGQEVAYMALSEDSATIYILNIETNRQESLGEVAGMAFAPRFSPDGTKLAYSVARQGNTDIWVMDVRTRARRRLTQSPSIDTSPSFSADGNTIAFTSDRGGSPQIYLMNADGGNVRRLSFGGGLYSTPVFSPEGKQIAFTKQSGGRFSIGVMNADGSGEKLLTSSYLEEGPTWAPNGRFIMYFREPPGALPSLWMVESSGRVERPVPYSGGASDPAWSPLLP